MDSATMWALGILSGASGGGFLLLLGLVNKVKESIGNEMKIFNERMTNRPTFEYLTDKYISRETLTVYFRSIDDKLSMIQKFIEDERERHSK